ncbi:hypothetical protein [Capnocytophaga leadbetteri]
MYFTQKMKMMKTSEKVFINFYKNDILSKQEILHYDSGYKEFLLFDEQGRITQKQYFEHKPYRDFVLKESINYQYFEDKVRCTYTDNNLYQEVIDCENIEYLEEFYRYRPFYNWSDSLFNENIFSYARYDKEGNEIRKFVCTYLKNGECETIFYRNGTPEYIIRKECTIVEN